MAAQGHVLPARSQSALDEAAGWFWNFLKDELTPYPGRLWVVGRVTIAATIVMLIVMTFQLPSGFLGAIFTLFLSRENPTATFRAGMKTVLGFVGTTAYTAFGVRLLIADPMTHFLWVVLSLFLSFYLLRIVADVGTGVAFGFMVSGAISLWDEHQLNVNLRMENTLWIAGVVAIGVAVTVLVEYVFRRVHPETDLAEGMEERLKTVEASLRSAAGQQPLNAAVEKRLSLYANVGTSRLRRLILRSEFSPHFKAQMSTAIALTGRLVDVSASFRLALAERAGLVDQGDRQRLLRLADDVAHISTALIQHKLPRGLHAHSGRSHQAFRSCRPWSQTVALLPDAFAGSLAVQEFVTAPLDEEGRSTFLVGDAFTNPAHLQFALRGTLAATVCYVAYTAMAWPGLSTSVANLLHYCAFDDRFVPGKSRSSAWEARLSAGFSLAWVHRFLSCLTSIRLQASPYCLPGLRPFQHGLGLHRRDFLILEYNSHWRSI